MVTDYDELFPSSTKELKRQFAKSEEVKEALKNKNENIKLLFD
jgi:c-di-GMP-related signal transduction protein